jgi:hypothetical protein
MVKVFISHSMEDRETALRIKNALRDFAIDAFLAHEDIRVSEEWRRTIIRNLKSANVFIPVLSKSFRVSDWASQELGLAISQPKRLIVPASGRRDEALRLHITI